MDETTVGAIEPDAPPAATITPAEVDRRPDDQASVVASTEIEGTTVHPVLAETALAVDAQGRQLDEHAGILERLQVDVAAVKARLGL